MIGENNEIKEKKGKKGPLMSSLGKRSSSSSSKRNLYRDDTLFRASYARKAIVAAFNTQQKKGNIKLNSKHEKILTNQSRKNEIYLVTL